MGGTGNPGIRRLKRLARGESTAVVMGMAGGILLAAVMWRGAVSPHREAGAAPRSASPEPSAAPAVVEDEHTLRRSVHAELAETVAELESLPDASESAPSPDPVNVASAPVAPLRARATKEIPKAAPTASSPDDAWGDATLSFWNAVNDIIVREAAMRVAPVNLTAANAGGFVEARVRAGRFAGDALRGLPRENVDRDALAHAADLSAWYDEEARLAGEASSLLGSSDFAARRGAAGKSWRNAEDKHRQRCDEINRRSATLQTQLSQKYGRPFPPLQ